MHHATWSTSDVPAGQAADYWRDLVCATFVRVRVDPLARAGFAGTVSHRDLGALGVSRLAAGPQRVRRDPSLIASGDEYVLANLQLDGQGLVTQHGRTGVLTPGSLVFVDSTEPYTMEFTDHFAQLVVRVPRAQLPRRDLHAATAVTLSGTGPAGVVANFLAGLSRLDPAPARDLAFHAVGLLDTALGWAARPASPVDGGLGFVRERVRQFLRRNFTDPALDADSVAAACGVSRRTLFRALAGGESFGTQLRRLRVARAHELVRAKPFRPLDLVAGECGFGSAAQLHRAFKALTGTTPAAYRAGTDRQEPGH
ncbi:MAG TPA: AraC family transcriptional regulator [Amycolatopsis sp.]|uniref:AraC family transcriptional regulator n=1 Tax=Amycolatopsis sp. TaxID=37632 RepID=UPI002F3EE36F